MTFKLDYKFLIKALQFLTVCAICLCATKSYAFLDIFIDPDEYNDEYRILGTNCNAQAYPEHDEYRLTQEEKSCKNLSVDLNPKGNFSGFKLKIKATDDDKIYNLGIGQSVTVSESSGLSSVKIRVTREADMACAYAKRKYLGLSLTGEKRLRREDSDLTPRWVFGSLTQGINDLKFKKHCVYLPKPEVENASLNGPDSLQNSLIAPMCFNNDKSATNFRFPPKKAIKAGDKPLLSPDGIVYITNPSASNYTDINGNELLDSSGNPVPFDRNSSFALNPNTKTYTDINNNTLLESDGTTIVAEGEPRSFTGFVVQCIEETMNNLFIEDDNGGKSFFFTMQERFKQIIFILLSLYVIFYGYQAIIEAKVTKGSEFIWFFIKMALVLYFAAGPGAIEIYPKLQTFTKDMSAIVLESSMGVKFTDTNAPVNTDGRQDALNLRDSKKEELEKARLELIQIRREIADIEADLIKDPQNTSIQAKLSQTRSEKEIKQSDFRAIEQEYFVYVGEANSFGYRYCDFSNLEYPSGLGYIKIWDILDCRVTKYLGIGDHIIQNSDGTYHFDKTASKFFLIIVSSIFIPFLGIIIVLISVVFVIYFLILVVRIVSAYVIASVGLSILFYLSPIAIVSALFKETKKSVFDQWLIQVTAYIMQPIMLFVFVAFLFTAFDMAIFKNNYQFAPITTEHNKHENRMCMKNKNTGAHVCTEQEFENTPLSDRECYDKSAIGCFYQTTTFSGGHFIGYGNDIGNGDIIIILQTVFVLIGIAFLGSAALNMMEELTSKITNAAASAMSSTIVSAKDPVSIGNAVSSAARSPYNVAAGAVNLGKAARDGAVGAREKMFGKKAKKNEK